MRYVMPNLLGCLVFHLFFHLGLAPLPDRHEVGHFFTRDEPIPATNPAFNDVSQESPLVGFQNLLA